MSLTGAPEDYREEAIHASFRMGKGAAVITAKLIQSLMHRMVIVYRQKSTRHSGKSEKEKHGEITINELNSQGRKLEQVPIDKEDLKQLRKTLNQLGVDYSIMKEKESDLVHVFFKGQDHERMYTALEQCLKQKLPDDKLPVKDKLDNAAKKSNEINKANNEQQRDQRDKSPHREKDKGMVL